MPTEYATEKIGPQVGSSALSHEAKGSTRAALSKDSFHYFRSSPEAMPMTLRMAVLAWIALCAARAEADEFPYTAYVTANDVQVRSGPGENYYPVLKVDRGAAVEVYRHDPGGWYAIRPPEACFSWVAAEFIEPGEGNVGVVSGDHVVARVGTKFSDTRDVIQVRLDRGEEVEILEAREFNSGPAAQTWYKIAPPAGEFRWISGRFVDRQLAESPHATPGPEHNLLLAKQMHRQRRTEFDRGGGRRSREVEWSDVESPDDQHDYDDVDDYGDEEDEPRGKSLAGRRGRSRHDDADDDPDGWEEVRLVGHQARNRQSGSRRRADVRDSLDDNRDDDMPDEDDASDDRPRRRQRAHLLSREPRADLKEEAADLDMALSAMVTEEPSEWEFSALRHRADAALARAETALERGRIRRVLRKIDNFSGIQDRYAAVMRLRSETDRLNDRLADRDRHPVDGRLTSHGKPMEPRVGLGDPARYDGRGRLAQVPSLDPRLPQFALVDSAGHVAAYVSPAPGVNLRRYLNQDVGINGTIGYLPDRQAQHLTARRIVNLDDPLRR